MRTIKFRAWHKLRQKMYDVAILYLNQDLVVLRYGDKLFSCKHEELELMQFTGLLGKNGEGIYEGDIVKIEDATAKVVFWESPPEFGLDFSHNEDKWCEDWNLNDDGSDMEIIGNVYEHPELLQ